MSRGVVTVDALKVILFKYIILRILVGLVLVDLRIFQLTLCGFERHCEFRFLYYYLRQNF